jgi:hypothetical protein
MKFLRNNVKHWRITSPTLKKDDLLLDVDGSETQIYKLNDEKVLVHNSYYLDEVYVESEADLTGYFK